MERKTILLISLAIILGLALLFGLYYNFNSNNHRNIEFTKNKLITNETLINMIFNDMKSPKGNNLTKVVIQENDPNIMDDEGKIGYYVCANGENQGWVYYSGGEGLIKPGLYGPYAWCSI